MTDKSLPTTTGKSAKQADKSPKNGIGGRLKTALDDMVWNGTPWEQAARKANLTVRSMRMSMQKGHVLRYIRDQRGVVLAQESSRNLARLVELRDQDENRNAAVASARTIENMANDALGTPSGGPGGGPRSGYLIDLRQGTTPGLQIVIVHGATENAAGAVLDDEMIDVTPNRSSGSNDGSSNARDD
jgi:hypothetical protein